MSFIQKGVEEDEFLFGPLKWPFHVLSFIPARFYSLPLTPVRPFRTRGNKNPLTLYANNEKKVALNHCGRVIHTVLLLIPVTV